MPLRKKDGKTRMHYKMWVTDSWLPEEEFEADGVTVDEDSTGFICLGVIMICQILIITLFSIIQY